jgi:hypothetical protein
MWPPSRTLIILSHFGCAQCINFTFNSDCVGWWNNRQDLLTSIGEKSAPPIVIKHFHIYTYGNISITLMSSNKPIPYASLYRQFVIINTHPRSVSWEFLGMVTIYNRTKIPNAWQKKKKKKMTDSLTLLIGTVNMDFAGLQRYFSFCNQAHAHTRTHSSLFILRGSHKMTGLTAF